MKKTKLLQHLDTITQVIDHLDYSQARKRALDALDKKKASISEEQHAIEFVKILEGDLDLTKGYQFNSKNLSAINWFVGAYIHEGRWMRGSYDLQIKPISDQIKAIEQANGLKEDEFWRQNEGPKEWQDLNEKYSEVLLEKEMETFQECLNETVFKYITKDFKKFRYWCEVGRKSLRRPKKTVSKPKDGLIGHIQSLEKESRQCANSNSYLAACVLKGAATEGQLLRLIRGNQEKASPIIKEMFAAKEIRTTKIEKYSFDDLIKIARKMEWLPVYSYKEKYLHMAEWAFLVKNLRNYIHPGKMLSADHPTTISKGDYKIVSAVYEIVKKQANEVIKT